MAGRKLKSRAKADDNQFTRSIMDSTHQIWLAGLGAFNVAQEEGSKLFDKLVKEGETVERKTRKAAEDRADEVKDSVDEVKDKAEKNWDKLEQLFQDRVAKALNRLGVPTLDDVNELSTRVSELNDSVKTLAASNKPVTERVAEAVIEARSTARRKTGKTVKTAANRASRAATRTTSRVKRAGDDATAAVKRTASKANSTLKKAADEADAAVQKTTRSVEKVVSA